MAITWDKAMARSKHFDKIAWSVTALILVITILFINGNALGLEVMARTMGYENRLFDNTRVHTIDIVMNDWDEFIASATSEEYYTTTLVVDGEVFKNVGIRGKGNTSLFSVSAMNSDRYSFKVEFDHYDSSTTYHGLDKLNLNNLIQDSTMMKDYLTYTMMNEFGATAPLCSFVYITVNGADWGLYLAIEGVEDSFLERNYGSNYGELYKPDSMSFGGGRGNGKDFNMDDFMNRNNTDENADKSAQGITMPQMSDMGNFEPPKMPGGFGSPRDGFGGMGASDVKLKYVDDDADSYSNIWNSAKTDISTADQTRLIESLKNLSNGEQIELVIDIDQVIRYFVIHNYVCNGDSYTGAMIHNYYLYEENGKMAMIPWDYNLAFGTFQGGNAQNVINTPIDSPVSGGSFGDRPMWNWIVANEEYTELYHQYFAEFLNRVDIDDIIDNAYNLIKPYVEKDPTAFYSYEEFETGVETIRQFCTLRSESISMQLTNGETTSNMNYVDGSGITLSDMGSMGRGGEFGGFGGKMPEGFDPSKIPDGSGVEMPKDFDPSQIPGDFNGNFPDQSSDGMEMTPSENANMTDSWRNINQNSQMPRGDFNFNLNSMGNTVSSSTTWIWLVVSVLILGAGLIIAKVYKD
jgi:spore coat protein CotH